MVEKSYSQLYRKWAEPDGVRKWTMGKKRLCAILDIQNNYDKCNFKC